MYLCLKVCPSHAPNASLVAQGLAVLNFVSHKPYYRWFLDPTNSNRVPRYIIVCHNNCINGLVSDVIRNEVKGVVPCSELNLRMHKWHSSCFSSSCMLKRVRVGCNSRLLLSFGGSWYSVEGLNCLLKDTNGWCLFVKSWLRLTKLDLDLCHRTQAVPCSPSSVSSV